MSTVPDGGEGGRPGGGRRPDPGRRPRRPSWRSALEDLPVGVVQLDARGDVLRMNRTMADALGLPAGGGSPDLAGLAESPDARWAALRRLVPELLAGAPVDTVISVPGPSGSVVRWRVRGALQYSSGRVVGAVLTVSELPGQEQVVTDAPTAVRQATGLPDWTRLRPQVSALLAACPPHLRVGLIYLRLREVAAVAEQHGALAEEVVQQATAERLCRILRRRDLVGRIGPAEFVVVLTQLGPDDTGEAALDRILDHLAAPLPSCGTVLVPAPQAGLSLARSTSSGVQDDPDALLAIARLTMMRGVRPATGERVASVPGWEQARLAALSSYDVHDGALDSVLQAFADVAASSCDTEYALVTFVDADLQWVRAAAGHDLARRSSLFGPRHLGACQRTVAGRNLLVIPDTQGDSRFPLSQHTWWYRDMRFYAGAPLLTPEGHAIGTLCVLDTVPRDLTVRQRRSLTTLAEEIMAVLEVRRVRDDFSPS